MGKYATLLFTLEHLVIPLHVFKENRQNVRISFTKNAVNLRVPKYFSKAVIERQLEKSKIWIEGAVKTNPNLKSRFIEYSYEQGDFITIFDKRFEIISFEHLDNRVKTKLSEDKISIFAPTNLPDERHQISILIQKNLARIIARRLKSDFQCLVYRINQETLNADISDISLKYNTSNWGSCSTKKNLNFSSRLLFAPSTTIRYVVIHELCHLREMNHSRKFWKLVEKYCADYKNHEKWLKLNNAKCDFVPDRYKH